MRIFEYGGFPPEANYLFLGDYIDRGKQSIETIIQKATKEIKPGDIIVLHDNPKITERQQKILPQILQTISAKGYNFSRIEIS